MNRLVCTSLERPKDLPPPKREGPARVMFVHGLELGFSTVASNLEQYMATRDDIDAVHLQIARPLWLRIAGMHNLPLGRQMPRLPEGPDPAPQGPVAHAQLLGGLVIGRAALDDELGGFVAGTLRCNVFVVCLSLP